MPETILEMKGIRKTFDGVVALKNVNFALNKGEIHGLIGENGAGKTTLMNVLGGVIEPDEGEIIINQKPEKITSPYVSKILGIAFVHQELNVINDLAVYENLFLGSEIMTRWGKLDTKTMQTKTKEILDIMQVKLDPRAIVRDLDTSYKQVVEIAKALLMNAKIIIMDEPTTSLTNVEIEHLFGVMKTLKNNGVSIIFISHKLKEIITVCDTYTVLRNGEVVANGNIHYDGNTVSVEELARYMVGRDMLDTSTYKQRGIGDVVLDVKNLTSTNEFRNVSFQLRRGEIIGFTGLLGDGRSELAQCIFGCRDDYSGEIWISGKLYKINHPQKALKQGIGYIPSGRIENGIIKDLSVMENTTIVTLENYSKFQIINHKKEKEDSEKIIKSLNVKVSQLEDPITSLSGGNQQKIVIAKWLLSKPDILICDSPTQGVDIGAKNEIYNILTNLASQNIAIILMSNEPQEIIRICDRAYVMYHGEVRGILERDKITEENIMLLSTGGSLA